MEQTTQFSRRNFLKFSAVAAGALSLPALASLTSARAAAGGKSVTIPTQMVIPTKESPIRVQYNENALGMSPQAQQAAIKAIPLANRYPFNDIPKLRSLVGAYHGIADTSILFTPGSSDAIRACIAAYATPETQFVVPELTYGDGELYARVNQLSIAKVPSDRGTWAINLEGMKQAVARHKGPSIIYLVNPNNPTSTVMPSAQIEAWIKSAPANALFIVDEAYAEFVNDPAYRSVDSLVRGGAENVLLLRTFSKIHAMAGMRVGYVVGVPDRLKHIRQFIEEDSMTLSYPAVMAATASIQDKDFLATSKKSNDMARTLFLGVLDELKLPSLPSQTNFVFFRLPVPLADFQKNMRAAHIIVGRPFPPADAWCRISLGTPGEMAFVGKTMREFRAKNLL